MRRLCECHDEFAARNKLHASHQVDCRSSRVSLSHSCCSKVYSEREETFPAVQARLYYALYNVAACRPCCRFHIRRLSDIDSRARLFHRTLDFFLLPMLLLLRHCTSASESLTRIRFMQRMRHTNNGPLRTFFHEQIEGRGCTTVRDVNELALLPRHIH